MSAAVSSPPADPAQEFLDGLEALPAATGLPDVRRQGRARFAESGFPTRRREAWRFSELKPLLDSRFEAASAPAALPGLDALLADAPEADRLVFVNGRFDAKRSSVGTLPANAYVGSFAAWAEKNAGKAAGFFDLTGGPDQAFLSLNAAFFGDGAAIILGEGVTLDRLVHVVHWSQSAQPAAQHVKSVIKLAAGASANVIETYAGIGGGWTNLAETVELGGSARLGHYTVQNQASAAFHTAYAVVTLGGKSHYDGFMLSLGGRSARQDLRARIAGSDAFCGYSGAYLLNGRQESAVCTVIEHDALNGKTKEIFKGCVADRAHGIFLGKIRVTEQGQKTDAYQLNKTLLLGERAVMDAKPELEIYADDVKCSHGATVGDLDETALFYLRSRGIPPDIARHMLVEAFVFDAIEVIGNETAKAYVSKAVLNRLANQAEPGS